MSEIPKADLYGKTVDRDSAPVPGVEVNIAEQACPPKREWIEHKVASNENGVVLFRRCSYGLLRLEIVKEGYLLDPSLKNFLEYKPRRTEQGHRPLVGKPLRVAALEEEGVGTAALWQAGRRSVPIGWHADGSGPVGRRSLG